MESSNTFPPMGQSQVSDTNQSHIPHRYSHHSPPPPTHSHRHGDLPSILLIVLPIILFFLIVFLILLISLLRRQKPIKSHDNNNNIQIINGNSTKFISHTSITFPESPDMKNGCINVGSSRSIQESSRFRGVQVFTYKELEFATDNFSPANVVGDGGYGIVYRGVLRDGTVAAIKKLHRDGKHGERAFRVEVDLLSGLHSPYLVELLGYCADQTHRLLIFEFMPNGSLQQHLHSANNSTQSRPLDWATRLRIALDCARALEFLHEHVTPAVIHRDFKCSNILLDCNLRAKVSDFGLAKMGSDKMNGQISTRVLGTTGYLAPEYAKTGKLTTKSDVYSYGVVLLQLITGRVPIDTRRPPGEHVLVPWALPRLTSRQKVVEMVDPALKGQFSKKDIIQIAAIAAVCVQAEPEYRPLITDVVQSMIPVVKHLSSVPSSSSRFPSNNMVSPKIQRHSF